MNIVITGATGFIGKNLYEQLNKNRKFKVLRILRNRKICKKDDLYYDGNIKKITKYFTKYKPKIIIHLATYYVSKHNYSDIENLTLSNELFTNQILESMRLSGIKNLIFTSTRWQNYYDKKIFPLNLYAAHKENCLNIIKFYANHYNINYIDLRLSDTVGKNDHRKKIFYYLKNYKSKKPFQMTKGNQLIYLTHINDIISSIDLTIKYLLQGKYLNNSFSVFSDKPIKLKLLVNTYIQIHNLKINISWGSKEDKKFEIYKHKKIYTKLPGWSSKIDLESSLKNI